MFKERINASNKWRGIISSVDVMRKGINMAVRNGGRTFFWHHKWATNKPLIELAIVEPPIQLQDVTIKQMWDSDVGWKAESFPNFLSPESLKAIAISELNKDEDADRGWQWGGSGSGPPGPRPIPIYFLQT